jgi:hypothetical protein
MDKPAGVAAAFWAIDDVVAGDRSLKPTVGAVAPTRDVCRWSVSPPGPEVVRRHRGRLWDLHGRVAARV